MTLFRKALLGIGALLVLLVAVGFMLPRNVHVERTITINAPRAAVFPLVNGFARFNEWSPWAALDPTAKYSCQGPAEGVGARISWVGDPATLGSGSQTITASTPLEMVKTAVDFGPQGKAAGTFTLAEEGANTRVTWGFDIDLGNNPMSRYFGLMFDSMIGADYERGLAGLKKVAEAQPRP